MNLVWHRLYLPISGGHSNWFSYKNEIKSKGLNNQEEEEVGSIG